MAKMPDHIKYHSNEEIPEEDRRQLGKLDYGFKQFSIDGIRAEFDSEKKIYTEAYVTIALPPEELYQEFICFNVNLVRGNWHLRQPPQGSHSLKISGKEEMFSQRFRFEHRAFKPAEIVEIINVLRRNLQNPPKEANLIAGIAKKCLSRPIARVSSRKGQVEVEFYLDKNSNRTLGFSLKKTDEGYVLAPYVTGREPMR